MNVFILILTQILQADEGRGQCRTLVLCIRVAHNLCRVLPAHLGPHTEAPCTTIKIWVSDSFLVAFHSGLHIAHRWWQCIIRKYT